MTTTGILVMTLAILVLAGVLAAALRFGDEVSRRQQRKMDREWRSGKR